MVISPTVKIEDPGARSFLVFLIERDSGTIEEISQLFRGVEGCGVRIFSSGRDALYSMASTPPEIVILAEGLPDEDDVLGLLSAMRQQSKTAYLIVLLPPGGTMATNYYLRAGANDCISRDEGYTSRLILSIKQGMGRFVEQKSFLKPFLKRIQPQTSDSTESKALQPGSTILHYRILAEIGHGGMGEVYKAEDLKLGRSVAIKILPRRITKHEDARSRLVSEARAASALNHPNIVTIYSIEELEGIYFIVMEYIEGQSIGSLLRQAPLPLPLLLDMGRFVAEALSAAHTIGVIHRDIKPGNIMMTERGQPKLLDFGLAKKIETVETATPSQPVPTWASPTHLTQDGQVMGTVNYMSPEQTRGEPLDGRSDIFSLGCVLYEAATGKLPFNGPTIREVMSQIIKTEPAAPSSHRSELPREFDYIISRSLAKDREERFGTALELAEALAGLRSAEIRSSEKQGMLIGVLYFENLSGAKEEEYFRDGMTEDIILELSKIKDLRILPRSAVVAYRDKATAPRQIGRELGAGFLLVGSIRRSGVRVRITTQLLDATTGHSLWSERYDRELRDILDIQEEIARSIAQALRITLSPQEEKAIASKPTGNPDAYDYYLRGRSFVRRATHADLEFAMQMFECAIGLEEFALAYAGLSNVCALFYDWYEQQERWIEKGLEAANSALALDPQLAEGLAARGRIYWAQRNYEQAIHFARLAIDRKPDCEGAYWTLGQALFSADRWQEVADFIPAALAASGDDYNVYVPLIHAMGRLGRTEDARQLRQSQTAVLKEQLRWVPEDVRARILLATNHASFGEREQAAQELQKAVSLRPSDANLLYNAACTYGLMEMKEEAFFHLKHAVANGFWNMEWVARDPDLALLHSDPEFVRFLKEKSTPKPGAP